MLNQLDLIMPLAIVLPLFTGILAVIVPSRLKVIKELIVVVTLVSLLIGAVGLAIAPNQELLWGGLRSDGLAVFIFFFTVFFAAVNAIYAFGTESEAERSNEFFAYFLWTIGAAAGVIFSTNMILFLSFWGFLGLTLYLMIGLAGPSASAAAKKTMLITGGADAFLILGLAMLFLLNLPGESVDGLAALMSNAGSAMDLWSQQPVSGTYGVLAFLLLSLTAFSKAGALPLHTWVPDAGEKAKPTTAAFLPGSLDKLLGIYFLYRICTEIFSFSASSWAVIYLMAIGALTIISAVMLALVQHNIRRLLGYHAVSQVGYMVLGLATLNPIGMAGGLFHMLNNAIYKSALFLCAGNVEDAAGTGELEKLGGLGKLMPLTSISMLIAALAISGIPPLNGFVSKWLVYRGLIETGEAGGALWIIWLLAAMFGSALTLASFIKVMHSVFWSTPSTRINLEKIREVNYFRTLPVLILAGICIVFGVAYTYPLYTFIAPAVTTLEEFVALNLFAAWNAAVAAALLVLAVVAGIFLYWLFDSLKDLRRVPTWVGGSVHDPERAYFPGTEFYRTIDEMPLLNKIFSLQKKGYFDVYELFSGLSLSIASYFSNSHTGVLTTYVTWALVGLIIYLFVFMGMW